MQKSNCELNNDVITRLFEQPIASFLVEGSVTLRLTVLNTPAEILSAGKNLLSVW